MRRKEARQGMEVIYSDVAEEGHRPGSVPQGCTGKDR